ncbi:hypothetical protein NP233_g1497 [Leucocoprinus birnbaumii]|uniref:Mitochondrial outer membrane transport complex Sam37/metaxin N-terminal domain-containing protein n=1 Tax=Leucocoprinus birnbaumii TaxID=56174 RepID=A0AAD5YUS4_9AGAR|nr:hypothetical protein NP233_g1497 [Leucocoprinus birnbaumii]
MAPLHPKLGISTFGEQWQDQSINPSEIGLEAFVKQSTAYGSAITKRHNPTGTVRVHGVPAATSASLTLFVWPGQWGLPSLDPICLATVFYLQLALPGEFSISECNNPDISPSGQLPFLIHDQVTVASFPAITKYVANLKASGRPDLDASLSPSEKSQKVAWTSHVESHYGNLVYNTFYSSTTNWEKVIHPVLVNMYGLPQRYYVPTRIRASYKPRLESAGLWTLPPLEPEKKSFKERKGDDTQKKAKEAYTQAFEKEKIQDKAKEVMGIYARLLEGKQFVYQGRPTTLDLVLAAHTLLLIVPPLPDTLIKELAEDWYDTLAEHARRIQNIAFGDGQPKFPVQSSRSSFWDLIPSRRVNKGTQHKDSEKSSEDMEYEKLTWGFIGLALGSVVAYFTIMGSPIRIQWAPVQDEEEDEEELDEELEDDEDEEVVQLDELVV